MCHFAELFWFALFKLLTSNYLTLLLAEFCMICKDRVNLSVINGAV